MDCDCETRSVKLDTPVGILEISGCDKGLHFVKNSTRRTVDKQQLFEPDLKITCQIRENGDDNNENIPKPVNQCVDWFCEYFSGGRMRSNNNQINSVRSGKHPTICPNLKLSEFARNVYLTVASDVRFGSRISYGGLAELIGHPKAARTVGTTLQKNPFSIIIPCHRVIQKSGNIGTYNSGSNVKQWLLQYEEESLSKK